jgi:hypothetical protein
MTEDAGEVIMRSTFLASIIVMLLSANLAFSSVGTVGGPVSFACSGGKVDVARKIARDYNLQLGMDPKACFGEMQLTESARKQIVVAAPSQSCTAG